MKWDALDKDQPKTPNSIFLNFGYIFTDPKFEAYKVKANYVTNWPSWFFLERDQLLISPGSTINLQHCRLSQQQKAVEVLSTIFC